MSVHELEDKKTCVQDNYDAYCIDFIENSWMIGAFAAGIPTVRYSGIGAEIAVEKAVAYCMDNLPYHNSAAIMEAVVTLAFDQAWQEISNFAKSRGHCPDDYDTMLSLVVSKDHAILYGCAGFDGIAYLNQEGSIVMPKRGGIAENQLSLQTGWDTWKLEKTSNVKGIIASSDVGMINQYSNKLTEIQEYGLEAREKRKWKGSKMAVLLNC